MINDSFLFFQSIENSCQNCAAAANCIDNVSMENVHYDLYAKVPLSVFNLEVDWNDDLFVFDKATGNFKQIHFDGAKYVHAHAVYGVFRILRNNSGNCDITFNATSLRQFSLGVAYFVDGFWKIKYRIEITQKEGLFCVPSSHTFDYQRNVYKLPSDYAMSTVLVLGLKMATEASESVLNLSVFANESGIITTGNYNGNDNDNDTGNEFNGYRGSVKFDGDSITMSDTLTREYGKNMRFNKKLYAVFEPPTLSPQSVASTSNPHPIDIHDNDIEPDESQASTSTGGGTVPAPTSINVCRQVARLRRIDFVASEPSQEGMHLNFRIKSFW